MTDQKSHADRMAGFRHHWRNGSCESCLQRYFDGSKNALCPALSSLLSDYADSLRLQLEAERVKVATLTGIIVDSLDPHECLFCDRYDWPGTSYQKGHTEDCPLVTNGFVTTAGKRTDAINPDGSTGAVE